MVEGNGHLKEKINGLKGKLRDSTEHNEITFYSLLFCFFLWFVVCLFFRLGFVSGVLQDQGDRETTGIQTHVIKCRKKLFKLNVNKMKKS